MLTHRDRCAAHGAAAVGLAVQLCATYGLDVFVEFRSPLSMLHGAMTYMVESVLESIPFVVTTAAYHEQRVFRDGVLAAVNASGDTDSNGAMVGAILGAHHGFSAIPAEWVEGLEAHGEIIALADQLLDLACARAA